MYKCPKTTIPAFKIYFSQICATNDDNNNSNSNSNNNKKLSAFSVVSNEYIRVLIVKFSYVTTDILIACE